MTSFRFFHTADIHLDSPLRGLAGQEGRTAQRIRTAARVAFDTLIGRVIEEAASFLIVAGDLYDGDWRDYQTGLFFVAQMGRLAQEGIPAFLLYGNHDAQSSITRRLSLTLPANVKVFGPNKPQTFMLNELAVALHGQSFGRREVTENLALAYPPALAGYFNIGVLHTGLGGMGGHANYAPCTITDLINAGYDYWALGHVHQHLILNEKPHVVFPGNLQGRHIRELGPKGACLVSVEDDEIVQLSHVPVDTVRWAHLQVAATDCDRIEDLSERIRVAMQSAVDEQADGRLLACRLEIQGRSAIHDQLIASPDQLLAEARAAALSLGEEMVWVEKLRIETTPKSGSVPLVAGEDALSDLFAVLDDAVLDEGFLRILHEEIDPFIRGLPAEIRQDVEDTVLRAAIDKDHRTLIHAVGAELMSRISSKEG